MITSLSNGQLKNIQTLLKKSKERFSQGLFVIEGVRMTREAIDLGIVEKAFYSESFFIGLSEVSEEDKKRFLEKAGYEVVTDSVLANVSETVTTQGVIATVKIPRYDTNKALETAQSVCMLENLQDPGNLGTIIRTAEAAGMDAIILSENSVDVYNPKVVRSTMGALFRMPIIYVPGFTELVRKLGNDGWNTIATHLAATIDFTQADYSGKTAVLIGNEGNGLTEETSSAAKTKVIIPMDGRVESLNAGIAAALMMYEIKRNRVNQ